MVSGGPREGAGAPTKLPEEKVIKKNIAMYAPTAQKFNILAVELAITHRELFERMLKKFTE